LPAFIVIRKLISDGCLENLFAVVVFTFQIFSGQTVRYVHSHWLSVTVVAYMSAVLTVSYFI